jgi:cytochrome c biogenesis protein CcdA
MRAWRSRWLVVAAGVALVFVTLTVAALLSTERSAGPEPGAPGAASRSDAADAVSPIRLTSLEGTRIALPAGRPGALFFSVSSCLSCVPSARALGELKHRLASGTARDGYARIAVFGAGYALASLSCTVAVVLAVVGQATATANPLELLAVFAAFAAGATSMLLALSVSVALASGLITRPIRRLLPLVNRLAGGLLVASGGYLIFYWLPVLGGGDGAADTAVARRTREISSSLQAFFATHSAAFAIVLGALAVTGAALALAARARRRPANDQPVGRVASRKASTVRRHARASDRW